MINGIHALIYSKDPDGVRVLFRDILKFPMVDAGHGWLIFGLPPAELGIHPTEAEGYHEFYLMCDDLVATVAELQKKGIELARPVHDAGWGVVTAIKMPGGGELGLYQPRHPVAIPTAKKPSAGVRAKSKTAAKSKSKPKPKAKSTRRRPRRK